MMIRTRPRAGFLGLDRAIPRMVAEGDFADDAEARRAIAGYERFFLLAAGHRGEPLVPSQAADLVWRRHLLDTPAYAEDCARWAGGFLHREDGAPPGGFDRSRALLGDADESLWDGPGSAHVASDEEEFEESRSPLECEDLSDVLERVRSALRAESPATPWVAEGRALLDSDPGRAVEEYRRFVRLLIGVRGRIAPSRLVDEFWHQHILSSRAYARFCARVAGRYLHHYPNYARPRAAHLPSFRRALALYRDRVGADAPADIWAHQGESEGGGCGGSGCGSGPRTPPTPRYVVDNPWHMRAELRLGRLDPRHRSSMHPVLEKKGVPKGLWDELLHAVEKAPRISWSEFATRGNSPWRWAAIPPCAAVFVAAVSIATKGTPGEAAEAARTIATLATLVATIAYAARWIRRPVDGPSADEIASHFAAMFDKHGVTVEYLPGANALQVDAYFTEAQMLSWEQMDRLRRDRELEERQRDAEQAAIAREEARLVREKSRLRRKAERDAYYLDRGIKPGPMAWYYLLPDWARAAAIGLAIAVPVLVLLALMLA